MTRTLRQLLEELGAKIANLTAGDRYLLGLVGYPAAGTSTLAERLEEGINRDFPGTSKVVPMDGFHYSNETLDQMQLGHLKGIPETFDARGFIDLLKRLRTQTAENVYCPLFDRSKLQFRTRSL